MRPAITMILVGLLLTGTAFGRAVTLPEALKLAMANSHRLQRAEANRQAAEQAWGAARGERLPTLSLNATAYYLSEVPKFDIEPVPGVSISREVGTDDNYQADVRLTLPLYTGGAISGNIELARATADLQEALKAADVDRLRYQTRVEFYRLVQASETRTAAAAAVKRAEIVSDDVAALYSAGAADSVDVLEADLAVNRSHLGIRRAEATQRSQQIRMAVLLGTDPADSIVPVFNSTTPEPPRDFAPVSQDKPELLAAASAIKQAGSRIDITQSSWFPSLSAYGGYSYGKPNLDRFNNTWNDYFTAGAALTWSFNLGGKTTRSLSAARWQLTAAEADRNQLDRDLTEQARLAFEQLGLAFDSYGIAKEEKRVASDSYRLARSRHAEGALATNRLLQLEADLTAAESQLAAALAEYNIALAGYRFAIGLDNSEETH